MKLFRKNTIACKLIMYIFVFSSLVTIILSTIELSLDYHRSVESLKNRVAQIRDSHLMPLALRLWNYDEEGLKAQLNGIIQLQDIEYVKVIEVAQSDGKNNIEKNISVGEVASRSTMEDQFLLLHKNGGQEAILGKLVVISGLDNIRSRMLKSIAFVMLGNTLKMFLISIFMYFIIRFVITRNLVKIANYTDNMSEEGRSPPLKLFSPKHPCLKISPCDELNTLVSSINNMNTKLREYSGYQKLAAVGQISSHIAHDMRSPLSVLKTYAGLKTSACDDQDVENLRQSAERSVGKLEHMAVDLVDYAKASKLQRARHQLSGIIYEGSIAEAKKRAEDQGVKIVSAIQGGILVNVDAYKLERVITNLVNNAVQAIENPSTELGTGGNGEVSIAATTEHNGVLKITIRDNGKGIDPEVLPHIFDSFFTKGKKGGSGLGLAYCKQVVEAHGGTIDVESELGKGTKFTIKIPNCAAEHRTAKVETEVQAETQPQSKPAFTNVLIADDDPEILREWQKIIPEHGGTIVHSAKTVKEVEDADLDYSKIDTAIVDYQFYGEDKTGIDLIKHLKAKGVKTIYLCTGFYDNEVIIKQAQAAGVERILPKPIDVSLLV